MAHVARALLQHPGDEMKRTRFKLAVAGLVFLGLLTVAALILDRHLVECLGAFVALGGGYIWGETARPSEETR